MDEKRVSITDNISAVTISRTTAEKLQRKQPIIRKDSMKRGSEMPNESEVQSLTINQEIWEIQSSRAEEIADDAIRSELDDPTAKLSPETKVKVRSLASKLIVIEGDKSATVYNNVEQAKKAKQALKQSAKTGTSHSTPE